MSNPEILTGANAVWVNDATGHCIGRFGPARHRCPPFRQAGAGRTEPVPGLHPWADREGEWQRFRVLMLEHHRVAVPDAARPGFLGGEV